MREIKFRAWDSETRRMRSHTDPQTIQAVVFSNDYNGRVIVMQYTGLKDKNNKEIYEGDLIMFDCETYPEVAPVGTYRIEYATTSFIGVNIEDDSIELHFGYWLKKEGKRYLEVIGNIYENPELLGGD